VRIVVSDTSPLRALTHLELLGKLFSQILIPPAVEAELKRVGLDLFQSPGQTTFALRAPGDVNQVSALLNELDPGESEAISLAIEVNSKEVLMDQWDGRQVALRLGLEPVGVIGILVRAKNRVLSSRSSLSWIDCKLSLISLSLRHSAPRH